MDPSAVVCVIDDDEFVRLTVCAALNYAGFFTVEATNGKEGLEAIRRTGARIAIVDVIMPVMGGLQTIAEAKRQFPNTKILAITAGGKRARGDLLTAARELGADECLAKPFRNEDLMAKISSLLAAV